MTAPSSTYEATVVTDYDHMYREVRTPDYWRPEISVVTMATLLRPEANVLDVAGGAGRHSLYLAERGHRLTTVDFSPVGVEKIKELANMIGQQDKINAVCANIRDGLPPGPFDGMVFSLMFQYLTPDEVDGLIQWAMANTQDGGLHALTFYLDDCSPRDPEFEAACIPEGADQITNVYEAAGWQVICGERHFVGGYGPLAFSAVVQRPGA